MSNRDSKEYSSAWRCKLNYDIDALNEGIEKRFGLSSVFKNARPAQGRQDIDILFDAWWKQHYGGLDGGTAARRNSIKAVRATALSAWRAALRFRS